MSGQTSREELAALGAQILREYRHPESWQHSQTTLTPGLSRGMVLKVEEIRMDPSAFVSLNEAQLNARAIAAFMAAAGIKPFQMIFPEPNRTPYLYVPLEYWQFVLSVLCKLSR